VRRADSTAAIGTALLAKAGGAGHRSIAARLHRPVSTVRRWLRGACGEHAEWLYRRAARLNRELLATRLHPFKSISVQVDVWTRRRLDATVAVALESQDGSGA
jgi:hypothetical protein